ncbi:MAG: penicillin-insensitive murein endopeptidase [Hyphomicrobiaceae bacterium]|jgi:penicillin-insensitive murein endopeptidase
MLRILIVALAILVHAGIALAENRPAKDLFSAASTPAPLPPEPLGFYSAGCLAGAVALPADGPTWQAMRPSRNRHWGLPTLIDFIETLSRDAAAKDGWPGLLVGDLSQPRGGPMNGGHASHQVGLDADLWLTPMPDRKLTNREREDLSATEVVKMGPHKVDENVWTAAHGRVIRRAALDDRVARIFVAPGIKKKLCENAGDDRGWLRKVRAWYGHNAHFHVRLQCPKGARCRAQAPPPAGDGCGGGLDYWYSSEPYKGPSEPAAPKKLATLADLPGPCGAVLRAPAAGESD